MTEPYGKSKLGVQARHWETTWVDVVFCYALWSLVLVAVALAPLKLFGIL